MELTQKKPVRRYDIADKIIAQIESYFDIRDRVNNLKKERRAKILEMPVEIAGVQEIPQKNAEATAALREDYHARIVKLVAQSNGLMKSIKHEIKILRMERGPVDNTLSIEELRYPPMPPPVNNFRTGFNPMIPGGIA